MKLKPIITTDPHAEHRLFLTEKSNNLQNSLFVLKDSQGLEIGFTGEEINSLAAHWITYRLDNEARFAKARK